MCMFLICRSVHSFLCVFDPLVLVSFLLIHSNKSEAKAFNIVHLLIR